MRLTTKRSVCWIYLGPVLVSITCLSHVSFAAAGTVGPEGTNGDFVGGMFGSKAEQGAKEQETVNPTRGRISEKQELDELDDSAVETS